MFVKVRDALIFKPEDLSGLAAARDINLTFTIKRRHFCLGAERRFRKIDWQFIENVITITCE